MATPKRGIRSTRKLRDWVVEQLESGMFPGVVWDDPPDKTMFRIPWKHAGKQEFRQEEDAGFFKAWAIYKGKHRPGDCSVAAWKTRMRCALSKSPEFEEMPACSRMDITEPYKVYRLVPASEQAVVKQPRAQKTKPVKVKGSNNSKECASPSDWIPQPADSLSLPTVVETSTPEAMVSHGSSDFYAFTYQGGEVSPQAGEAGGGIHIALLSFLSFVFSAPDMNEIILILPDSSLTLSAPARPTEEFSLCLSISYFGELIQKCLLPEGEFLITSVAALPDGPANCMNRIVLPPPVNIADSPKQEAVQRLLKDLEKGVMVASNHEGIFIQCRGTVCISWWGFQATEGQRRLENNAYLQMFKPREFRAAMEQYHRGLAPLPDHQIVLSVGDTLEGNKNMDCKPIVIQMEQAFALRLLCPVSSSL
ncbi:interferon regulatory factor 9 [Candoia aspera]|uniref:interferon regulatory factor 9 n=1 Tax=Candoia aspera TaxID=51853 RepID=UPI002FD813D7